MYIKDAINASQAVISSIAHCVILYLINSCLKFTGQITVYPKFFLELFFYMAFKLPTSYI